jgi:hypothetical protein
VTPLIPKVKTKKNHTFYLSIASVNSLRVHAHVMRKSLAMVVEECIEEYVANHGAAKFKDQSIEELETRAKSLYQLALRPGTDEHSEYMEIALAIQERLKALGM